MVALETRLAIYDLYAAYSACLDAGNFKIWPDFFTDDCVYKITPRENYDRGLPLSTLALRGKGMLRDRVYGIEETLFHQPYYQRHIVSLPLIENAALLDENHANLVSNAENECAKTRAHDFANPSSASLASFSSCANYLIIRTKQNALSEVFNAGRYIDNIVQTEQGLKFSQRLCVFDSELILNSLIYPV